MPSGPEDASILRTARERGTLRIVTLNSPTTMYEGRDGLTGFEYDLASAYARHLQLKLEWVIVPNVAAIFDALDKGEADLAAAGLSETSGRLQEYRFSVPYLTANPVVVCNRLTEQERDISKLDMVLAAGSSFPESLQKSGLHFASVREVPEPVETLLAQVVRASHDCTMADSHVFALQQRYLPGLRERDEIDDPTPIAWVVAGGHTWRNVSLLRDMDYWFDEPTTESLLQQLEHRYFVFTGHEFDYVDLSRLRRAIREILPRYRTDFERAGTRRDLPWEVLAAMAWQESRWRPDATSHTGVRGMMMLTQVTASEQGVMDRLDPVQSINGGARYLASLKRRVPESIKGSDRLRFALAAYNMGWNHMMDARILAQWRGKNPDRWADVAAVLPLLQQRAVYKDLPHGFARGQEALNYVRAVMNFADIIEKAAAPKLTSSDGDADTPIVIVQADEPATVAEEPVTTP